MYTLLKKFRTDERGNIAIIFGFAVIPFMLAAGMAVDYGRAVVAKHELQTSLDSAVLAAGSLLSAEESERKALGKAFFEANFDASYYGLTVPTDLIDITNNVITADESISVRTSFMQLVGLLEAGGQVTDPKYMTLGSDATAVVPTVGKAEIALVLDYSGSMDDPLNGVPKFETMRDAAINLMTDVATNSGNSSGIQFSLVPFSYGVKASLMGKHVTDEAYEKLSGEVRTESCFSGRKTNVKWDTEPADGKRHRWQQMDLWYDNGSSNGDRSYRCDGMLPMRELTSVHSTLIDDLNEWEPDGGTHIASGFQFGWHSISPNTVFPGGAGYDKVNHENPKERVLKAIVLLTDGAQTVPAYRKFGAGQDNTETSDPDWPMDKTNGEHNLEKQCRNAKTLGVIVVTVAFDLDDEDTILRLNKCATPKDPDRPNKARYAYKADSIAELNSAFNEIGNILAEMVYLSQ